MTRSVTFHIFGGRGGESIVIRLPSGEYGLIDCYADLRTGNPVLEFLEAREVKSLLFAAYTHPHFDHYTGLPEVLRAVPPKSFFRPVLTRAVDFREALLDDLRNPDHAPPDAIDERKLNALDQILEWENDAGALIPREMLPETVLFTDHDGFEIEVLSPTINAQRALSLDKRNRRFNLISAAFVVRFGNAVAVLGGDLEREGWLAALDLPRFRHDWSRCRLFKVAHHGSDTGSFPELWESIPEECLCVIANNSQHGLPNAGGLAPIGDRVTWVTHLADAQTGSRHARANAARDAIRESAPRGRQVSLNRLSPTSRIDVELFPDGRAMVQSVGPAGWLSLSRD